MRACIKPFGHRSDVVSRVVIYDKMNIQMSGHFSLDLSQERQKLLSAMAGLETANDFTSGDIERSKQRRSALPEIVMCPSLSFSWPERENWLTSLQCLNLAFFINTENQSIVRKRKTQPYHVPRLCDKVWIDGNIEGFGAVRLKGECLPDTGDGLVRKPYVFAHSAGAPLRGSSVSQSSPCRTYYLRQ